MKHLSRSILPCLAFASLLVRCMPVNAQVAGLSFRPVDAAYSLALDRIILVSASPNQLHIYDPVAHSDQTVALSGAPQNVSLSPDGTHAAVGFVNAVAYVDLQGASVTNTFSNIAVGTGEVICGSGYIYVFPNYNGSIISINIGSSQATTNNLYTYASGGVFDPAVNAVYSTENGISPNSLNRFDASGGVIGATTGEPFDYFDLFSICGPLWLSHDGSTIYSACGTVYRASTDPTKDMRYLGVLPGVSYSPSLATSDSLNQIAVIPGVPFYPQPSTPLFDTVVNLYSSSSFNAVGQFATTPFHVNSASFPAHGRWVFYNSSSSALFIITQADSSAGLQQDYAVENINLSTPNSCASTFGATSATAIAAGSYATTQILSGEDCVFTAVSNVPWIVLASGYYGSGNTTLKYLVRPNLSGASRSGSISVGSDTFTVTQDAAGPASPLTPLSFQPVAAAYDKALDKIVMVSASPNELHIYDPVTQSDQLVPLTYIPLSVSVRPDGLAAAVGHSGQVSIVDLQAQTVSKTIPVDMNSGGIALASNGYAYTFPSQSNGFGEINSIQISTGRLTTLEDSYDGNIPRLDASGDYLYVGSLGTGASKLNISNGPATVASPFLTSLSGNIWLSEAGNRLITSTGKVLFTSVIPAQDLQPDGQLSAANSLDWAADSQLQQQIAVLTDPTFGTAGNAQLQIYGANGLQLQSQVAMPAFSNGGTSYASHGKYVFWNAAASKLFAITEADSASGLLSDFALYTVAMPESLPGCTYAVSPSSINVPPSSYTSWVFNVTSNCSWTAVAGGGTWLQASTYGSTVGNGQFTVYVQSNSGAARSGSVAVGNQTVTINQADSTCTYALSSTSASFSQLGGTGAVNLTTGASCSWSVQSNASWLTLTSTQSGTGPATIQFSVAPTASSPVYQYGSLNIAGLTFNVIQSSTSGIVGPALSVSPVLINFGYANVLTRGVAQTITIHNPTTGTLPTGNITLTGANPGSFSSWTDCGATLALGASCSLHVTFSPLLVGYASANIQIPVDANGNQVTVFVSGIGQLTGAFEIVSMPTGKVLEVAGAATSNGASIAQNALNGFQQQQWHLVPAADGYYVIQNDLSGRVLDVTAGSTQNGALIQQWDYLGNANQQWKLMPVDDVHYAIVNRQSGLALDVIAGSSANGASLQQWTYSGNRQQLWVLEPVGSYNIANNLSSDVLDVTAASTTSGALIQQWSSNGYRQQQWQLLPVGGGYYAIMNRNSGKVLDVTGASTMPGAFIQQWDYLQRPNQQWQVIPLDGTSYEIVNRQSGFVLDLANASTMLGTQIQQSAYSGARNQQWQITPVTYYNIVNVNSGLALDVVGGSTANSALIQQWSSNGLQQQQWQLLPAGNGTYALMNNLSSKVLDVTTSSTTNGAQIDQEDSFGRPSQQWQFVLLVGANYPYEIRNLNSGKALDVTAVSTSNGALIQQWDYLAGANQQWQLFPVSF